jgi:hypothetical protein
MGAGFQATGSTGVEPNTTTPPITATGSKTAAIKTLPKARMLLTPCNFR